MSEFTGDEQQSRPRNVDRGEEAFPSQGYACLLESATNAKARKAKAEELWRLRWDRRKLREWQAARHPYVQSHFRNAQANLAYYLAQDPPVSSNNYYLHDEAPAPLRCRCIEVEGWCVLHPPQLQPG